MSPLKGILVSGSRRSRANVSSVAALGAAFVLALTFGCRAAAAASVSADAAATDRSDARRAEKILAGLRLLHDAADAVDSVAYRRLAAKLYPGLFVKAAELRQGDLSTDLSTAVFLAEELGRSWFDAGNETADCRAERPDIYAPLCESLPNGTVRELLLAKSRMHARWAEAVLKSERGESDALTARALAEMKEARANDALIAARVVETLRPLEALASPSEAGNVRKQLSRARSSNLDDADADFEAALREAASLLSWMPRSQVFYQLSAARRAYADGLWWQSKARGSKGLVVNANNFQPDPLEALRLDAEQVSDAAEANLQTALKRTRLVEQSLSRSSR